GRILGAGFLGIRTVPSLRLIPELPEHTPDPQHRHHDDDIVCQQSPPGVRIRPINGTQEQVTGHADGEGPEEGVFLAFHPRKLAPRPKPGWIVTFRTRTLPSQRPLLPQSPARFKLRVLPNSQDVPIMAHAPL